MQNQTSVSVNWSWIGQAWKLYTDNTGVWLIMMIIYIAMYIGFQILFSIVSVAAIFTTSANPTSANYDPTMSFWVNQIINVLSFVLALPFISFFTAGFFKAAVKQAMGGQITVGDLFSGGDRFWPVLRFFLCTYLIMAVIAAVIYIPTIFLNYNFNLIISPGNTPAPREIFAALGALLIPVLIGLLIYIVILSGMFYSLPGIIHGQWGAIESIRNSFRLVGSKILIYAIFTILVALLSMSGVFLCIIGLLITAPFYITIPAVAYREVVGGEIETMPLPPPPPDHWMNNQQ